ncbi:MAG: Na(+)/H(+) antiporter subunit B [Hyphomicrobiaceae bacterium]|nr:Na(+)/H(+) antiporter subunit B [Hyphomicrobiaceae bacterium]
MKLDVVFRIAAKIFIPFMLVFALYVQFHGELGPGGGFQAGVVAAAMVVFYAIIFGLESAQKIVPPRVVELMVPAGVGIFAGVGVVSLLLGENYLNYSPFGGDSQHGQEYGIILVEIGVLVTVTGTLVAIFYSFVGRGRE